MEKNTTLNGVMELTGPNQDFTICLQDDSNVIWPHVVSMLVRNSADYSKVFCRDNRDLYLSFTNNYVAEKYLQDFIKFYTDFGVENCDTDLKNRIDIAMSETIPLINTDLAISKLKEYTALVKEITYVSGGGHGSSIEVFLQPNDDVKQMLEITHRTRFLVSRDSVSPDLGIVALGPKADLEFTSIKKFVKKQVSPIYMHEVIFVHPYDSIICGQDLNLTLTELLRLNIATEIENSFTIMASDGTFLSENNRILMCIQELVRKVKHFLPYGSDCHKSIFFGANSKETFFDNIKDIEKTKNTAVEQYNIFSELSADLKKTLDFALNIFLNIPPHNHDAGCYTKSSFCSDGTSRSSSFKDEVLKALSSAQVLELHVLEEYFHNCKQRYKNIEDIAMLACLQEDLRLCMYSDFGLGCDVGRAKKPRKAMRVEESILAKELLEKFQSNNESDKSKLYIETLEEYGIPIDSHSTLVSIYNPLATKKLEILRDVIGDVSAENLTDFILHTHIRGLRAYAEYEILVEFGMSEEEAMKTLKELPF